MHTHDNFPIKKNIRNCYNIGKKEGITAEFEPGVATAARLFQRARGCLSLELQRGVEAPNHYRLCVGWAMLEDHTEHFRGSADFQTCRGLVGHCFERRRRSCTSRASCGPFRLPL